MLYPKIKPTINISPWREGFILRSHEKNSGQIFINILENKLVRLMNGENSMDDLERSLLNNDPLLLTKLLRSLWHRDMLEESENIQQLLFPEQKQFLKTQKRKRNLIGMDFVQIPLNVPPILRNPIWHHPTVNFLAATFFISSIYLCIADHVSLPSSPFSFNDDWVTGSLFSYFGASIFLSIKALYQGQILSTHGSAVTWNIRHIFGFICFQSGELHFDIPMLDQSQTLFEG